MCVLLDRFGTYYLVDHKPVQEAGYAKVIVPYTTQYMNGLPTAFSVSDNKPALSGVYAYTTDGKPCPWSAALPWSRPPVFDLAVNQQPSQQIQRRVRTAYESLRRA